MPDAQKPLLCCLGWHEDTVNWEVEPRILGRRESATGFVSERVQRAMVCVQCGRTTWRRWTYWTAWEKRK